MNRRAAMFVATAVRSLTATAVWAQSHDKVRTEEDSRIYRWLIDRLTEVESVKVGMSRAQLLQVFMPDGGLQRITPERYVLRSCGLIKVQVEFRFPEGTSPENPPADDELTIASISKPYLEPMDTD